MTQTVAYTLFQTLPEPLNGASLFSTVVRPRAYLDTPSAHIRPTFHIGLKMPTTAIRRGATRIAIISRCVVLGEARFAPTVALLARIRNATLFFALKVQYNLAQGSALGYDTTRPMRPVGVAH